MKDVSPSKSAFTPDGTLGGRGRGSNDGMIGQHSFLLRKGNNGLIILRYMMLTLENVMSPYVKCIYFNRHFPICTKVSVPPAFLHRCECELEKGRKTQLVRPLRL